MTIPAKVGAEDKIFGSITALDIVEKLTENKITLEKHQVILETPIKELGNFKVPIRLTSEIQTELLPKDETEHADAVVEIRAGAGGDEAGLFASELFRMYQRYAETNSWKITLLETMRRRRDLPDIDAVFNEGDYPIVLLPNDGARAQRLYGREGMSNGQKPPPLFSPTTNVATTRDLPFPDFSFSPPGVKGGDRLSTTRWSVAHGRLMEAGVKIPFE